MDNERVEVMRPTEPSKFSVYSIRGLPAGVWGESYAVIAAFEFGAGELMAEYFLLTKRPKEVLHSGRLRIAIGPLPPELGKIDIEFALEEGLRQTELSLIDLLEVRAGELSRPDVAHLQFELKPTSTSYLLSCWMRGQFNSQLKEIQCISRCSSLARYLGYFSQVSIVTRMS